MSNKAGSRNQQSLKPVDESDLSPKPLTATLLQEFQNLKDKFKNEDETQEKGLIWPIIYHHFKSIINLKHII